MSRMKDLRRQPIRVVTPLEAYDPVDLAADPVKWMWHRYHKSNEAFDYAFIEKWRNDLDGVLVFTGLFSAMVSAFFIDSYKNLQPDPEKKMAHLLAGISTLIANPAASNSLPPADTTTEHFAISTQDLRACLCFLYSLFFSVTSALAATLVQRWARMFTQDITTLPVPGSELGRRRALTVTGATRFLMPAVCEHMPFLLHLSVFLFFAGLVDYLKSINDLLGDTMFGLVMYMTVAYAVLTVLPLIWRDCPYQTPVSFVLWRAMLVLTFMATFGSRLALKVLEKTMSRSARGFFEKPPHFYRPFTMCLGEFTARARADGRLRVSDAVAIVELAGLLKDVREKGAFLQGVNGFLRSCGVDPGTLDTLHYSGVASLEYLADHAAPIVAVIVSVLSSSPYSPPSDPCDASKMPEDTMVRTCMEAFRIVTLRPTNRGNARSSPMIIFQSTEAINAVTRIVPLLHLLSTSNNALTAVTARSMLALIAAEALYIASLGGAERAGFVWMVREHLYPICRVGDPVDVDTLLKDGPYACVASLFEDVFPHVERDASLSYVLHPALRVAAACTRAPPVTEVVRTAFNRINVDIQLLVDGMVVRCEDVATVSGVDSKADLKTPPERMDRVVKRRMSLSGQSREAYRRLLQAIHPLHTALVQPTVSRASPSPSCSQRRRKWLPCSGLTHRYWHGRPSSKESCGQMTDPPAGYLTEAEDSASVASTMV